MPTLAICDETGRPLPQGVVWTFAAMFYPYDHARREEFAARVLCGVGANAASRGERVTVSPASLKAALRAEDHPMAQASSAAGRSKGRWYEGTVAGVQVEIVWALAHQAPQHASRRKAVYLMERLAASRKESGVKSSFDKIWSRYHPVAHLWAAFNTRNQTFTRNNQIGYTAQVDFGAFIAEAEVYREWGETHYAPPESAKRTPLLDPASTWKPPSNWTLTWQSAPDWPSPPDVPRFCLPDSMMQALDDYSAKGGR